MRNNGKSQPILLFFLEAGLILTIFIFYLPVLKQLIEVIANNEDYWVGFLLPGVSAFLVYRRWPQVRRLFGQPSWLGLVIIALGFFLYLFGELLGSLYLPSLSFIVILTGLVYLVGGRGLFRCLSFPLFLLVLMIPYEGPLLGNLTLRLQLVSTQLAAGILDLLGFPVLRQGNVLDLGSRQLDVVAACSGLRYIVNLLIMGAIFCYFFQRRYWKITVLLFSLIPYAILGNAIRLATIGVFPIFESGWWHSSIGLTIFLVGFDYLRLINWILNHLRPEVPRPSMEEAIPEPHGLIPKAQPALRIYLIAALSITFIGGFLVHWVPQATAVPLIQSLDNFPRKIGPWEGKSMVISGPELKILNPDNYLYVDYLNPNHGSVSLWLVHYGNMVRSKFLHPPASCLQGGGGIFKETGVLEKDSRHPINYIIYQDRGITYLVYYWVIVRGEWVSTDSPHNRLIVLFEGLQRRRNDGILVRLITPIGTDPAGAHKRLAYFTEFLKSELPQFIR